MFVPFPPPDAPPFRRNVEDGAARWDSLMQKSKASANKKSSKKRVIDSDSEYDSEMDDFIDDGDAGVDVSSMIKDIFGYDKNKFVESLCREGGGGGEKRKEKDIHCLFRSAKYGFLYT